MRRIVEPMPQRTARRPRPSLRRLSALAVVTSLALTAVACGTDTAPAPADLSGVTLRVGATGWKSVEALLRISGQDRTPYTVQWSVFTGGDKQMQAIRAGALDVASTSEIPPIFAAAAGGSRNFTVVAVQRSTTLSQEVVVGKGSTLTGIAGLKGRKVGYVQNTTAQYFLYQLLLAAGLRWTDIQAVPLLPNDGVAALNGGSIDAFASYGNSIITVHQTGGRAIGSGQDILSGNFPWLAGDALLAEPVNRAALVDLFARINRAYAFVRDGHYQQYAQEVSEATHQPVTEALSQLKDQEAQRPTVIVPTSPQAIASEQSVADAFTALDAIPSHLDVAAFWTDRLNADLTATRTTVVAANPGTPGPTRS